MVLLLIGWLGVWFIGEGWGLIAFSAASTINGDGINMILWMLLWTAAGLLALRHAIWLLNGREVIVVGNGQLILDKEPAIFGKAKVYEGDILKDIRIDEGAARSNTHIVFGKGDGAVMFGKNIGADEARIIVEVIKKSLQVTT